MSYQKPQVLAENPKKFCLWQDVGHHIILVLLKAINRARILQWQYILYCHCILI